MSADTTGFEAVLAIVSQRPLAEQPEDTPHCPACGDAMPKRRYGRTTLVGGGDGTWNGDVNHTWGAVTCPTCQWFGARETKSGNVWYTDAEGRVWAGVPTCFEDYIYTCAACGGPVTRTYLNLNEDTPVSGIGHRVVNGAWIPLQRTRFQCAGCGATAWPARDHL